MELTDTFDVISYAGSISMAGYEAVCDVLKQKQSTKALLVLATPGGDPHAAFRIARALQHDYETFEALVPRYCKSAGTLVLIGASKVYLDDMSELGPLDVQVKKGDELVARNSGLDIFQAVNYLHGQAMASFGSHVTQLTREVGLSRATEPSAAYSGLEGCRVGETRCRDLQQCPTYSRSRKCICCTLKR